MRRRRSRHPETQAVLCPSLICSTVLRQGIFILLLPRRCLPAQNLAVGLPFFHPVALLYQSGHVRGCVRICSRVGSFYKTRMQDEKLEKKRRKLSFRKIKIFVKYESKLHLGIRNYSAGSQCYCIAPSHQPVLLDGSPHI